jgi:hypothetical protein
VFDRFIPGVLEQDVASLFSSAVLGLRWLLVPLLPLSLTVFFITLQSAVSMKAVAFCET